MKIALCAEVAHCLERRVNSNIYGMSLAFFFFFTGAGQELTGMPPTSGRRHTHGPSRIVVRSTPSIMCYSFLGVVYDIILHRISHELK